MGEIISMIGQVIDFKDDFVTLTSISPSKEFRVPSASFKDEPELTEYYRCTGYNQGKSFLVQTITKLQPEDRELQTLITTNIEQPCMPALTSLFPNRNVNTDKGSVNLGGVLNPDHHKDEEKSEMHKNESEPITSKPSIGGLFSAVILTIDKLNLALMFSPSRQQFITCQLNSLQKPLKIGKWYMLEERAGDGIDGKSKRLKIVRPFNGEVPLKTRIINGNVHLNVLAYVMNTQNHGFWCCYSPELPHRIIDSSGLLNNLDEPWPYPPIRNAPVRKVRIWCSLRKYPIEEFYWKITQIPSKMKKPRPVIVEMEDIKPPPKKMENGQHKEGKYEGYQQKEGKYEGKKQQKPLCNVENRKSPTFENKNQNMQIDGFVCSKSGNFYIVYSPKWRMMAYLDKRDCHDNLLGMWINFKIRDNFTRKIVVEHRIIRPIFLVIPTFEHVMFRTKIDIPRALEDTKQPICDIGVEVTDRHGLLRQAHCGRTMNATVGCAILQPPLSPGNELTDDVKWEILYLDDD